MTIQKGVSIALAIIVFSVPATAIAAKYTNYTYKNKSESNYHLTDSELSADGSIATAIGGTSVVAFSEVAIFTPTMRKPAWKFIPGDSMVIFDQDISADGSTIVACGSAVWLIDTASQEVVWTYDESVYVFDTCTLSNDGSKIFAGSRQSQIFHWAPTSNEPEQIWTLSDGGFIDKITISNNGKKLLAENSYSYAFLNNTSADTFTWEKSTTDEIYSVGLSSNGRIGYVLAYDRSTEDNDDYYISKINTRSPKFLWKKMFTSYNTPYARISANGKRIVLTTNKVYYGLNAKNGKTQWKFNRQDGDNTTLAASANNKFIVVTEGLDYTYFFDWDYPSSTQRPFQIDGNLLFPSAAGVSADGSTATYEADDYTFQKITPGILADLQDTIPIYTSGQDVDIRYFVSNPGVEANLTVRTTLSLPQFTFLTDLGESIDEDEPDGNKSKLWQYAQKTLPGYKVADTRSISVNAHESSTINTTYEMPNMLLPNWVESLLGALDSVNFFGDLLGELSEPLGLLSEDSDTLYSALASESDNYSYPMIGLGRIELMNEKTGKVYSRDTFIFIYVL